MQTLIQELPEAETEVAMTLIQVALPVPLPQCFDYWVDNTCEPGMRVQVSFGARTLVGVVIQVNTQPTVSVERIKPVLALLDDKSVVPPEILALCTWASSYYHHPIGEVI